MKQPVHESCGKSFITDWNAKFAYCSYSFQFSEKQSYEYYKDLNMGKNRTLQYLVPAIYKQLPNRGKWTRKGWLGVGRWWFCRQIREMSLKLVWFIAHKKMLNHDHFPILTLKTPRSYLPYLLVVRYFCKRIVFQFDHLSYKMLALVNILGMHWISYLKKIGNIMS